MDKEMILDTSDEAATYRTDIKGWVSRKGHFFGEREDLARYDGCTHRRCRECGKPAERRRTICETCIDKLDEARFQSFERVPWDGKSLVYSEVLDSYFESPGQALEDADSEEATLESLRVFLCSPNYVPSIEDNDYVESLPDGETELPDKLKEAIDTFNQAIEGIYLSWSPTNKVIIDD